MPITYAVLHTAPDWTVMEGGKPLVKFDERARALEMAQLLTLSAKAAGREAAMAVEVEGGALTPWDVEDVLFHGDTAFMRRRERKDETRGALRLVALR